MLFGTYGAGLHGPESLQLGQRTSETQHPLGVSNFRAGSAGNADILKGLQLLLEVAHLVA